MSQAAKTTPISGLEMRVLSREISRYVGWYVSSIHSLGENQVFRMKSPEGDVDLVVSPALGAWITKSPAHGVTNEFTTSLRGKLLRYRLEKVEQLGLDRVLFLDFGNGDHAVRLVLELMPPGNIILVETDHTVSLALREFRTQQRSVGKGRIYAPPPQNRTSPEGLDSKTLSAILARENTVGKALGRGLSLPRRYVDEILARVSLSQERSSPIPPEKEEEIERAIGELLLALEHPGPCLVETPTGLEIMVVQPVHGTVVETAPTVSELMDKAFSRSLLEAESEPLQEDREAKEIEVTVQRLRKQMEGLGENAARLRELAVEVRGAASREGASAMLATTSLKAELLGRLNSQSSAASMSSMLYDEAKSAEAEVARIREVELGLSAKLKRTKKVVTGPKVRLITRERKEWYQKFRWFVTSEGKLAIGGRDAQSNTILVKKHVGPGDVVYHADLFGSPFFVLKEGEKQTAAEVRQLGQATASFSSAWKTGLAAADAYWVNPDQVSGSAPSGEYLSRGSFSIRGKKNFVTKNAVELAIGLDAAGRVVSGPEEALMKQSRAYLVIVPSREKSSDTAKKVLFELKKVYGESLGPVNVDDIMRALPTGGGKIVRKRDSRQTEPGPSGTLLGTD